MSDLTRTSLAARAGKPAEIPELQAASAEEAAAKDVRVKSDMGMPGIVVSSPVHAYTPQKRGDVTLVTSKNQEFHDIQGAHAVLIAGGAADGRPTSCCEMTEAALNCSWGRPLR